MNNSICIVILLCLFILSDFFSMIFYKWFINSRIYHQENQWFLQTKGSFYLHKYKAHNHWIHCNPSRVCTHHCSPRWCSSSSCTQAYPCRAGCSHPLGKCHCRTQSSDRCRCHGGGSHRWCSTRRCSSRRHRRGRPQGSPGSQCRHTHLHTRWNSCSHPKRHKVPHRFLFRRMSQCPWQCHPCTPLGCHRICPGPQCSQISWHCCLWSRPETRITAEVDRTCMMNDWNDQLVVQERLMRLTFISGFCLSICPGSFRDVWYVTHIKHLYVTHNWCQNREFYYLTLITVQTWCIKVKCNFVFVVTNFKSCDLYVEWVNTIYTKHLWSYREKSVFRIKCISVMHKRSSWKMYVLQLIKAYE